MRNNTPHYPVDRYLVESSKKFNMVNIIDDDIWNTEPALKPEDELILRKLHEMLQSTSDDLKMLSGELSKFREPGVQVKMTPTPLDEEFNEKVHIEEVVNAKFHGYKIIEKPSPSVPEQKPKNNVNPPVAKLQQAKVHNTVAQEKVEKLRRSSINRNLEITRTKIMQINGGENNTKTKNIQKLNNAKVINAPAVVYSELFYKYEEPKPKKPHKKLQVQEMPSINIRSELKEQKVLVLDIIPDTKENEKPNMITKNVAVVAVQHDIKPISVTTETCMPIHIERNKPSVRKVSKLSTYESSGSTNNVDSDTRVKLNTQKRVVTSIRSSPKNSARSNRKKVVTKKEKAPHLNLDEWRQKLNAVYGTSNAKKNKSPKNKNTFKVLPKKPNASQSVKKPTSLNNAEYIPYSKLTIGGVKASDIEKEISNIPDKNAIPLSPILDRILSSRENSFSTNGARKYKQKDSPKVLTTSDENLLQEVIDIERTVSGTLSKELKNTLNKPIAKDVTSDSDKDEENDSYADDFEDEKSDKSWKSENIKSNSTHSDENKEYNSADDNDDVDNIAVPSSSKSNIQHKTFTKSPILSFKNSVDVYEYIHSLDVQDSATQSNSTQKIYPKETQTSPRNDNSINPIHNDLWPVVDPIAEVEKMFKMEKELIKNLIVQEYGDLLEKNYSKPSTSKSIEGVRNVVASQKNTQTSPAHVKDTMTSPTRTKTRTTSPFAVLAVDHHTSPLIFITNEKDVNVEIEEEDLGISINLSSPRFSLRLPQNSREVLSNLGDTTRKNSHKSIPKTNRHTVSSTSSIDADSSEISSLGEVKLKLRRKLRKDRLPSSSESTCSSSTIQSSDLQSGILPLRSEGEMSLGNKKYNKHSKSEGETSFGLL